MIQELQCPGPRIVRTALNGGGGPHIFSTSIFSFVWMLLSWDKGHIYKR